MSVSTYDDCTDCCTGCDCNGHSIPCDLTVTIAVDSSGGHSPACVGVAGAYPVTFSGGGVWAGVGGTGDCADDFQLEMQCVDTTPFQVIFSITDPSSVISAVTLTILSWAPFHATANYAITAGCLAPDDCDGWITVDITA